MERKALAAEFKVDASKRQVEGYASTFGNRDLVDDVVVKGAYTKTIAERLPKNRIKVMRDHKELIGKPVHVEEDSTGLFTVSQISKTALGDETLTLVEDGVIDRMSIGYETIKADWGQLDGHKVRFLRELKLPEYSMLAFPANESASITGVKSLDELERLFHEFKAGRVPASVFADACHKAAVLEADTLAAPAGQPESHEPITSVTDSAEYKAFVAEIQRTHAWLRPAA